MSVYIQITTHCNMTCEHCIFACSSEKRGEFMSPATLAKSIELAECHGLTLCIGGGEPTLHPKFWEFFGNCMAADVEQVWMATNGSNTNISLALAGISCSGKFSCALSRDIWHDNIDQSVVRAFEANEDCEIRSVTEIVNGGSAAENGIGTTDDCGCSGIFIMPKGQVKACSCLDSPIIGEVDDIDDGTITRALEILGEHGCHKNWEDWHHNYIDTGEEPEGTDEATNTCTTDDGVQL